MCCLDRVASSEICLQGLPSRGLLSKCVFLNIEPKCREELDFDADVLPRAGTQQKGGLETHETCRKDLGSSRF